MAALLLVPAGCAAVVALSEALKRQRRWELRRPHQAKAPSAPKKKSGGAPFRARAYRGGMTPIPAAASTGDDGISDVDSVTSDQDFRRDWDDDASSVDSFSSEVDHGGGSGRKKKRLMASSACSDCSSIASGGSICSLASIAEFEHEQPDEQPSEELMEYAVGLRPLFVTRAEVVKILAKFPHDVLNGPQSNECPQGHVVHRELLEAICSSIACVVRPEGAIVKVLCLADGFTYSAEEYALTTGLKTRLLMKMRPLDPAAVEPVASFLVRVTEMASRELFIAELLAMDRVLRTGMQERFSSCSALKRRRRTLRHVADVIKVLRPKRSDRK